MKIFAIIAAAFAVSITTTSPEDEWNCFKCIQEEGKNTGGITNLDDYS